MKSVYDNQDIKTHGGKRPKAGRKGTGKAKVLISVRVNPEIAGILWNGPESPAAMIENAIKTIYGHENCILTTATRLAPKGELIPIPELRKAVDLPKEIFDQAVLNLSQQGKVFLHKHIYPAEMNPIEQAELVKHEEEFFVGIVVR